MLSLMELARRKSVSLIELIKVIDNSKVAFVCTEGLDTDRLDRLFEEIRKENRNETLQLLCRTASGQSDRHYGYQYGPVSFSSHKARQNRF